MTEKTTQTADVILIGAGPIGLEMAVALKDRDVDYLHLDAKQVGHTISWFPRQAHFFSSPERISICGVPLMTVDQSKATREEYLAYLLGIVRQFELAIRTYERVTSIERHGDGYRVQTVSAAGHATYIGKKVIVAMGDMHGPRPLVHPKDVEVPGCDLPHISRYFEEPHPYFGKRLLIIGGKNSAAEAAIRCYRAGAHVTWCQRETELSSSIKYWLRPELEWLIQAGEIAHFAGWVPVEFHPTETMLARTDDQKVPEHDASQWQAVATDFVLLLIGYVMDSSLLADAGVDLYGPGRTPRLSPETMESNLRGLYVIGTAAAGTQLSFKLFIENCHAHVVRVVRDLTGKDPVHINRLAYARLQEHPLPAES